MKIADVGHNQDSGTTVICVDHWPAEGFGVGAWIVISNDFYRVVAEHKALRQIEVVRA